MVEEAFIEGSCEISTMAAVGLQTVHEHGRKGTILMKRTRILALAAVMAVGVSAPALADYVRLGSVNVGYRSDYDTAYSRFGGRMEGLRFTADHSDVFCRFIRVNYADGSTDNVFSGRLDEDRPVNVDLRGGSRRVDSINFRCRSDSFRGGKIYIMAEVGRYRDEWRSSPDWTRLWAGVLGLDRDSDRYRDDRDRYRDSDRSWDRGRDEGDWITLDTQTFSGRYDTDTTYAGWRGRHIDRLGLRPVDNDARCSRVTVRFGNGEVRDLDIDGHERLDQGRVTVLDFPGDDRDVRGINMACHAAGGGRVTIELLARR
jgi:hypothetical protein